MAESPILLLGGAAATLLQGRGALQDIDQMSLFKSLCKFCASVRTVREIIPVLRKAIAVAQSGTPGPVFVELPIDTLYPYHLVEKEVAPKTPPKGLIGKVQECVEIVSRAKKPLILLGSQVTLPPVPADKTREVLETLGIPCFLGGMARGMLGRESPIHIRQNRKEALKEADVVILAGTVCDFRLGYGRVLSRHSKIIAANRDHSQLLKNSDMFWKPCVAVQGDAASFLLQLSEGLKGYRCPLDWPQNLKERDILKEKSNRERAAEKTERHLNPLKVLHLADELIAEDSIIVADGGDFVGSAAYIMKPRGPLRWLDPGAFGTLGVGGGFALGAKLCRPESETPVISLVGNDACWSQISREQVPLLGSNVACGLAFTDYHIVADGYGGKGYLVSSSEEHKLDEIIKSAQRDNREGRAALINVLIGKSTFREGSISV
ncbi:ILVBL protein, partial [Polypterus senegalus]